MAKKLSQPKPEITEPTASPDAVAFTESFAPKLGAISDPTPSSPIDLGPYALITDLRARVDAIAEIIKQNYGRVV